MICELISLIIIEELHFCCCSAQMLCLSFFLSLVAHPENVISASGLWKIEYDFCDSLTANHMHNIKMKIQEGFY